MHASQQAFLEAKTNLLKNTSKILARALILRGDTRSSLARQVLQVRSVEREAMIALGAVRFNGIVSGDMYVARGMLFIKRTRSTASRYVGGEFVTWTRGEGPETRVLLMRTMVDAENLRGKLWLDTAIQGGN